MKKLLCNPGDIVRLPLYGNRNCYGRMYRGSMIGVYIHLQKYMPTENDLNSIEPDIVAGVFTTDFKKSGWMICGNIPFLNKEAQWAPPTFSRDILDPKKFSLYHKGKLRHCREKDIKKLHEFLMYKPERLAQVIESRLKAK